MERDNEALSHDQIQILGSRSSLTFAKAMLCAKEGLVQSSKAENTESLKHNLYVAFGTGLLWFVHLFLSVCQNTGFCGAKWQLALGCRSVSLFGEG